MQFKILTQLQLSFSAVIFFN